MSHFVVGITGGIGSGKTAVTERFEKLGINVIDADVVAREVVEPGSFAVQQIRDHFGLQAVLPDGHLDRSYLRELVFSSPEKKHWLDKLLHPLIRQRMLELVKLATSPYCLLSVPLLVENKMTNLVNRTLVVDVDEATQLKRAANRDQQSQDQIKNIMSHQASRAERLSLADDVIDNNGQLAELESQIANLHQKYLQMSEQI